MASKRVLAIVGAVGLLLCGFDLAAPYLTLSRIKAAAQERNGSGLASYIDFPPLRASLASQLRYKLALVAASEHGRSTRRTVGGLIGLLVADKVVGLVLTEDNLSALLRGDEGVSLSETGEGTIHFSPERYRLTRSTLSDFWVCPTENRRDVAIHLRRSFPTWKITGIILPTQMMGVQDNHSKVC